MHQKMVLTSFRRSLSFPNPPPSSKPRQVLHVRSTSLPCRSHPIISQLRDEITQLNSWSASQSGSRSSAWLCGGLSRLKAVHESLDDLLHLPQARESLRRGGGGEQSDLIEKLLEDFLRFVDIYGTFQTLVLRLKEEYSSAQIAVRRKDDSKIAINSKNLSKIAKEIGKLVPNTLSIGKSAPVSASRSPYDDDQAEMIDAINDVIKVTVSVSISLFGALSSTMSFRKASWLRMNLGRKTNNVIVEGAIKEFQEINLENLRKKSEEELKIVSKNMHEMEDCIVEIEGCGERAFRSLINTRVSLLNVLTQ